MSIDPYGDALSRIDKLERQRNKATELLQSWLGGSSALVGVDWGSLAEMRQETKELIAEVQKEQSDDYRTGIAECPRCEGSGHEGEGPGRVRCLLCDGRKATNL